MQASFLCYSYFPQCTTWFHERVRADAECECLWRFRPVRVMKTLAETYFLTATSHFLFCLFSSCPLQAQRSPTRSARLLERWTCVYLFMHLSCSFQQFQKGTNVFGADIWCPKGPSVGDLLSPCSSPLQMWAVASCQREANNRNPKTLRLKSIFSSQFVGVLAKKLTSVLTQTHCIS